MTQTNEEWTVEIFSIEDSDEDDIGEAVRGGRTAAGEDLATAKKPRQTKSAVPLATLSSNLAGFAKAASALVASAASAAVDETLGYELDEVKITAVMEKNGQFGFQGTSVGVRLEGGLELTFKRVRGTSS